MNELLKNGNIANVELIELETIEETPKTYMFRTATTLKYTGVISAGNEQELRIKNAIHGMLKTEDLVKGYDLEIADQILHMIIYATMDGGTYTPGAEGTGIGEKYEGPVAGEAVNRTAFNLRAYTSDRDSDGEAIAYHKWTFPSCKGKPVDGEFKDGEFSTNNYKLSSRPAHGVSPMSVERIAALPEVS